MDIYVYSNYIAHDKEAKLLSMDIQRISLPQSWYSSFIKKHFYPKLNESLLWGINWFLDVLNLKFGRSVKVDFNKRFDFVINLSSTVMCDADIMWLQGPPFVEVVESMAKDNIIANIFLKIFRHPLANGSKLIISKMASLSKRVSANSNFIATRYSGYPFTIGSVIYTNKEFSFFEPKKVINREKYVLTYIGKETDIEAVMELAHSKIKLIAFGAKVPPGVNLSKIKRKITFLGNVPETDLRNLYSNALFVAFPFTNEPFGWIPIESMLCGTPVLSYAKEGPSETIINGVTGWLVNNKDEFVKKAKEIWDRGITNIDQNACIARGKEFTIDRTIENLTTQLNLKAYNEIYSYS